MRLIINRVKCVLRCLNEAVDLNFASKQAREMTAPRLVHALPTFRRTRFPISRIRPPN